MTAEHLQPIADNFRDKERFCQVGELMARGQLPQEIQQVVRMERMTALKKTTVVRGIVAGDIVRRLVAKTHLASDSGSGGEGHSALSVRLVHTGGV